MKPFKKMTAVAMLSLSLLGTLAAQAVMASEKLPAGWELYEQQPSGWSKRGDQPGDYATGLDRTAAKDGHATAFIKSVAKDPHGFGTLMQAFSARAYRGKRVRLAGLVKTRDVKDWAGLWMRVDGPGKPGEKVLSFDNMQDRPIRGTTDWKPYEIVLDVPQESEAIAFGILLSGAGQAWIDGLKVEDAALARPTKPSSLPDQPVNLNFEEPAPIFSKRLFLTLSLNKADVRSVLRMMAEKGKMNLVMDEAIAGNVTLKLTKTTLDEAFVLVLDYLHLTFEKRGNTLFVRKKG